MVSTMKANIDELGRRFADHEKRVDARFESSKERIEQTEKRIHESRYQQQPTAASDSAAG